MRIFIIFLLIVASYTTSWGQDFKAIKKAIEFVKPVGYPYSKPYSSARMTFHQKIWNNLPIFVYKDLQGKDTLAIKGHECYVYKRFVPTNGDYYLVLLAIGDYLEFRKLLVTFDTAGQWIDYLEVEFKWDGVRAMKVFKLTEDMQVVVYNLQVDSPESIIWTDLYDKKEKYPKLKAQRHDFYYQIDKDGKFLPTSQIDYHPQEYPRSYFTDEWEERIDTGREVPLNP